MLRFFVHVFLAFALVVTTTAAVPCACEAAIGPLAPSGTPEAAPAEAEHDCCAGGGEESAADTEQHEDACAHCEIGACGTVAVDDTQSLSAEWGAFELPTAPIVPVFAIARPAQSERAYEEPVVLVSNVPLLRAAGWETCVRNQVIRL